VKKLAVKSESFNYLERSFKEWLDILGYSEQTVYQLPVYVRELFHWLEQQGCSQIEQITNLQVKQYYNYLKERTNNTRKGALSNNYLNKHQQGLLKFMDYLRQSGRKTIPYLAIRREDSDTKDIQVLSVTEIKALYEATKLHSNGTKWEAIASRDRAMLSVFYSCGLRRNEGYHLNVSDINFDRKLIHVKKGKGYKERMVPFNQSNSKILENYIYDHRPFFGNAKKIGALFVSIKGNRMNGQSLVIRLKLLQQRTDDIRLQQKDIALHALRHSIATHLLQAGMGLEKISKFLGHSSLESTQIYTHLIEQDGNI
tara:strand:+ start:3505 stop:4443 length:939 start_codon:yes stop_codon:yes gene_type:complete